MCIGHAVSGHGFWHGLRSGMELWAEAGASLTFPNCEGRWSDPNTQASPISYHIELSCRAGLGFWEPTVHGARLGKEIPGRPLQADSGAF